MTDANFDIELFWDDLLSQQAVRIQAAFDLLSPAEQSNILEHLRHMVSESGWHPSQVAAARIALQVLLPGRPS